MSARDHIVRRQVYELTLASRDNAHDLQERLGRLHRDAVVPVVGEVLSSAEVGSDLLLIERLDLDLGTLSATAVEEQLVARIGERLAEALEAAVTASRSLETGEGRSRRMPADRAGIELLRRFLATGALPWWAPAPARGGVGRLLAEPLDDAPGELVAMLRSLERGSTARRLARQFPKATLRRLLALLDGPAHERLSQLSADWQACLAGLRPAVRWPEPPRLVIMTARIEAALAGEATAGAVSRRIVRELGRERRVEPDRLAAHLARLARRRLAADRPLARWLRQRADAGPGDAAPVEPPGRRLDPGAPSAAAGPAANGDRASSGSAAVDGAPTGPAREAPRTGAPPDGDRPSPGRPQVRAEEGDGSAFGPDSMRQAPAAPPAGEGPPAPVPRGGDEPHPGAAELGAEMDAGVVGELVTNAGLVIAWPFLPRLFERLDLVTGKSFVSRGARERAVLLTQFLVTGEAEMAEHELILNKLLCGWPLEEAVAGGLEITAAEREEIADLFASILEHWSALGNTSAEGFRASFLARDGLLDRRELGWNLRVARTGYDVLLDKLPWAIGFVMLPWMEEPLVVEW